jgi:hypothetical protein
MARCSKGTELLFGCLAFEDGGCLDTSGGRFEHLQLEKLDIFVLPFVPFFILSS